jgi:cysteine-rich repeat protein
MAPTLSNLTLTNNGTDTLVVPSGSTSFVFNTALNDGQAYSVAIAVQPDHTTCVVSGGGGTISGANVNSVSIECTFNSYPVGGTLSGLTEDGLGLSNNGSTLTPAVNDTTFTFPAQPYLSNYQVDIVTQPLGLTCTLLAASGMVMGPVADVSVSCSPNSYTVGGNITGLSPTQTLTLQFNGATNLPLMGDGPYAFSTVLHNTAYTITVIPPPLTSCSVANATGTVRGASVTNVDVTCVSTIVCGDGMVQGTETCDDGNTTDGDGCSAVCAPESGWSCTGTPNVCTTTCGDGIMAGTEACDDANTASLDGCSSTCRIELSELEPNEDGTPSVGGTGIAGNDFDVGGTLAINNATAQGIILASGGSTLRLASLSVGAAPGTAGDEDVFAISNDLTIPVELQVDVWNRATGFGLGVPCGSSIDTGLNIRGTNGTVLASNDDRNGSTDRCSGASLVVAAGATVYAQVVEFGDNAVIPGYALQVRPTPVICGDNRQVPGFEECDDGNTTSNDGCSATCTLEGVTEVEPNEDGTPATGGGGITGNDFDVGGSLAVNNALAQGAVDVSVGGRIWLAALSVGAAPGTAGDEDVFAVTNTGTAPFEVQADTWDPTLGRGRNCVIDTGINVRDGAGAVLVANDQTPAGGNCSRVIFVIPAGQTRYLHVVEFGDNAVIGRYVLEVLRRPIVCGDNIQVAGAEECDDGNTVGNDGCSAACTVEGQNELEPNEDGTPATGGTGIVGNDFVAASAATVVANAIAQGVSDVGTPGRTTWLAALRVGAAPGTGGDEDVFALTNSGTQAMIVTADTWDLNVGINRPCPATTDTGINIRDAAGTVLVSNDNRVAGDSCSRAVFVVLPGASRYVHVTEFGDNAVVGRYALVLASAVAPFSNVPLACTDMAGTTPLTLVDPDEGSTANTALPFNVSLFGATMVSFSASANGGVQLFPTAVGTAAMGFNNPTTVPSATAPNGYVAPFWDDLDLTAVRTQTTGTEPNRRFTVEWSSTIFNVAGSNVVFQAQFVEGGPIEFHYCSATGDAARTSGSGATVAVENTTGTTGFAWGINAANSVTPGTTAIRWLIP